MKKSAKGHNYFFVDESGDTTFYNRKGELIVGQTGCSPILLLGFVETTNPYALRRAILDLQQEVVNDPYYEGVPSLTKTAIALHAKDDIPEIRKQVYERLATLDFRAQFVVARKLESVFTATHKSRRHVFYDDLIVRLFENVLHYHEQNFVTFAKRGSRDRQAPLESAIEQAIARFEARSGQKMMAKTKVQAHSPNGEPCLSVVDYMNWAVYRAFTRGEMRFFNTVASKVTLLVDLYDFQNHPNNWYSQRNPFHMSKITPL